MILDDIKALQVLQKSQQTPEFILQSRKESKELFALVEGDDFLTELIERIEHIESTEKQEARKKYSRDIAHFYERLLRPVDNVYSATGGSKIYKIDDEEKKAKLLKKVSRARDGKSLQEWLKANWMPLYHTDPNGVVFIEYLGVDKTDGNPDCWPTYKNIDWIRSYAPKGQLVDWILFEPKKLKIDGDVCDVWRLVDDVNDRWYKQNGEDFTLIEGLSFEHPFGQTPALINSDIEKLKGTHRLSPIDKVLELSKEYARDQSIKTLHKKYHGFATMWKYVDQCQKCQGAKKDDSGNICQECDGHGFYKNKDVTDFISLRIPEGDEQKLTPDIAGYITPPIEIWDKYDEEIKNLYEMAHETHWGTMIGINDKIEKTATAAILNSQPMMDKLDTYSDVAEMMEAQITEWFANFIDESKKKDEKIASINYGRRFIIDPPDAILEKYQQAKEKGDNNVILDRLLNEYFTAKYRNDPEFLRVTLVKAEVEPYIHQTVEQVNTIFGRTEAQKKVLFEEWWSMLSIKDIKEKTPEQLKSDFNAWFEAQQQPENTEET